MINDVMSKINEDKTSLLTASGMLEHAFPSMFVSSLRQFQENCAYKHGELN
jgi:hypothetical protein